MSTTASTDMMLLTEKEVAKMTSFSIRTLQSWRTRGDGPQFVKISARCVRYRARDVEDWIEQRLRLSTSDSGSRR
jgi:predicted DNA-binding transcriptional regulator AlpA